MTNEKTGVLAFINGVPPSNHVLDYSTWAAKKMRKTLKVIHNLDQQYMTSESDLSGTLTIGTKESLMEEIVELEHQENKLLQRKANLILENTSIVAKKNGVLNVETLLKKGRLVDTALELESETAVAVIGKYGQRHLNKSTENTVGHRVESLVRALKKPVLVVDKEFTEPKEILFAYDGSEPSRNALNLLETEGLFRNCRIHIVYVGEESDTSAVFLEEALKTLEHKKFSCTVTRMDGEPVQKLIEFSEEKNMDMIIMGAFSHSWLRDLIIGSFTSEMLHKATKPLLLVR